MLRDDERLAVTLRVSGLTLPNPVGLAAGFDKNAEVASAMLGFGFGFVECGTVTPRPQAGNPRPRLFRLTADRAVINRMGFNNDGLDAFARRLKASRGAGVIGANVGANKDSEDRIADYVAGVRAVWANCSYVTINISSPNTPGLRGLQDRGALEDLLGRVGEAAQVLEAQAGKRPVFLKVAPDLDDRAIEDICEISLAANGLTGLIVSNTTLERPATLRSAGSKESGGLSGAPLLQTSTRVLAAFAKRLGGRRDLIGAGGIANADDVLAKLAAGADAVQLYSALVFEGPGLVGRIKRDLARRLSVHGGWAGAIAALDQNQATGLSG
jgi:dihydroorotate dehydrogenase